MNDNQAGVLGMRFYRFLGGVLLAGYAPFALLRSLTGRRRLGDVAGRLGRLPYPDLDGGIWVHAVSVGEVGVAATLLTALAEKSEGRRLGLSVTTAAGRELAERIVAPGVSVFAFPFDLAGPVARALAGVRPGLVLLTETELWPLFLDRAGARGISVALVNGRISQRSYPRYRLFRRWFARAARRVSLFLMQSEEDARRIRSLGAVPSRIRTTGNVKYDLPVAPPFADADRLLRTARGRPVLVAASTAEGEEEAVLDAWRSLSPRPLLVIAPRRPERFDDVANLVGDAGFPLVRRSIDRDDGGSADVYLLDTIGELASVYSLATLAFVGGSLVRKGGHNPIEAWAAGVPVVVGPHTENFREINARGKGLEILTSVAGRADLAATLAAELADPERLRRRGAAASRFVSSNRGAAEATAREVLALLPPATFRRGAAR